MTWGDSKVRPQIAVALKLLEQGKTQFESLRALSGQELVEEIARLDLASPRSIVFANVLEAQLRRHDERCAEREFDDDAGTP